MNKNLVAKELIKIAKELLTADNHDIAKIRHLIGQVDAAMDDYSRRLHTENKEEIRNDPHSFRDVQKALADVDSASAQYRDKLRHLEFAVEKYQKPL